MAPLRNSGLLDMVELESQKKKLEWNAKTFIVFKKGSGIMDRKWQILEMYTQVSLSIG